MAKWEFLIFVAFSAIVCCTEVEDSEQKKRGVGKGTSLNSLTSGAQKQDYTYSIYSSNPSSQSSSSSSYQPQAPSSFYPSQTANQYYSSPNTQFDTPSYSQQQQPQLNLSPPSTTSQFAPLNFVPNPGYQAKYQIIPSKSNGNIQLAIYQQPGNYPVQQVVPYSPQLFSSNPSQVNSHQGYNIPQPHGQFNVAPNYHQVPLGGSYLGQPSAMLLFAQPNLNQLYNNLVYPNPVQSFYNYYPSNTQSKYNVQYVPQGSSAEYEKLQGPVGQNIPREENDITHNNEYTLTSDSSSSYKNAYSASRNS
ncbi:unnamed protein product [Arctia plantaginis]|uniref:Uncharacterized protein n=1 Tax=Arctia plantaginis TaxID=874455 RepID=A0A8S1AHP6_ARCPL|nr:unnamed protein product [Arctia plantaginis]